MNKKTITRAVLAVFAAAALLAAGYVAGTHRAKDDTPAKEANAGRKVLYWHDPMSPNQHFDKPGKSPFMDMQLEPVFADEGGASTGIKIDSGLQQNLGIRYATARRVDVSTSFDAVGTTQFDESLADVIQSRVTGYIDRLYANAPMQRISKGAPVASLFVPDWLAPQEEYLALKRSGMDDSMLAASRARMRALSIPDGVVASLDRTGKAQTHVTLTAPSNGVVSELDVRDGAMVAPGQTLAKIAGLNPLWLVVEVPEAMALQVKPGMSVDAVFAGDAAQHFTGHIRETLPGITAGSRTLQARLSIDNKDLKLTPGMLMRARIGGATKASRLVVPSESVITTGKRSVVIVKQGDGRLQPVTVTTGIDTGGDTEVLNGLNEGEEVVASGQFLIDSEASLKSVLPRLAPAVQTYETTGKVEAVTGHDITLSHQPVAALGWGAMTMSFGKPSPIAFADVKPGETVHFAFRQSDDGYQLTKVDRMEAGK
ncbi:efflux RND transporter periplasmic adaptor subunit [Caballeronia sordidicola]|uniref:Cobalt/zinc/cadmium efflux RND transporter, membrane fusion protein, CzcB family n=2 Tax=Caballeronia TaxID=1827195 RepID=A0A242N0E8_CABSO|nr:efflux RND transporter periplasmic adaptor subunit [Caballeronia sordidicola]OTP76616.1 Cobalt/zinc/cadmium efflux RND transporter, membrane fusion protein, CzcB family [Caballeronia sordidicola]